MHDIETRKMILVLGILAFWVNGDSFAAAPLLVGIASDLQLDISQAALSVVAYMLPFGIFTLLFGPLADRYGKARIINYAAFATAIFSGLGALAFDLTSLCIVRALNGAFASAILPVTMSLIGDRLKGDPKAVQSSLNKVFGLAFLGGACATAISGVLAYFGSWRLVYIVFGLFELAVAIFMLKILRKDAGTTPTFSLKAAYGFALSNLSLLKPVAIIFLMGMSVSGSFVYAGKYVEIRTGFSILVVGFILTSFGIATVVGSRFAPVLRRLLGNKLFMLSGVLAAASWGAMGAWDGPLGLSVSLAGFGFGFILLQPVLVATAQEAMPKRRGTAMSLVAFAMLTGGGLGAYLNSVALSAWGYEFIFGFSAVLILVAGLLTTVLVRSSQPAVFRTPAMSSGHSDGRP